MTERGDSLRFALKPVQRLTVFGEPFGEELQGDKAAELCVFGLVNHTLPAATKLFENPVMGDSFADHGHLAMRSTLE